LPYGNTKITENERDSQITSEIHKKTAEILKKRVGFVKKQLKFWKNG